MLPAAADGALLPAICLRVFYQVRGALSCSTCWSTRCAGCCPRPRTARCCPPSACACSTRYGARRAAARAGVRAAQDAARGRGRRAAARHLPARVLPGTRRAELQHVLEYALRRMLPAAADGALLPAICLRVFYQVRGAPSCSACWSTRCAIVLMHRKSKLSINIVNCPATHSEVSIKLLYKYVSRPPADAASSMYTAAPRRPNPEYTTSISPLSDGLHIHPTR
ncbi:hypothetical protein ACJJTC_009493 [Scirpophaga incertulas]